MSKKIYVKKSRIHGAGLFARQNIKKGEVVFIMKGNLIKMTKYNRKRIIETPNIVGIDKDVWIDPIEPYYFINHSCNPTVSVKGKVTFVALRDIVKGEEISFDYSISEDSPWTMQCHCGSQNCRGVIKSIRFLPQEVFERYNPVFPTYFKKLYCKLLQKNDKNI